MLNPLQQDKLAIILNDELLISSIEAVFNETINKIKPDIEKTDNNSVLGEKYRSYEIAKQIIKQGFIDLRSYQEDNKVNKTFKKER